MRRTIGMSVVAVLIGLGVASDDVGACENEVAHRVDPAVQLLSAAEKSLRADGSPAHAAHYVVKARPKIRQGRPGVSPVDDRALQLMATATARLDGEVKEPGFGPKAENLAWAVTTLETLRRGKSEDVGLQNALGEALSRVPARRNDALSILRGLAAKDLIPSPFGYAALARVQRSEDPSRPSWLSAPLGALGQARAVVAEARCKEMAGEADSAFCSGGALPDRGDAPPLQMPATAAANARRS
jgi:hypothetical protein